ncbi:MAG: PD40 domain-containing protein [Kofleriaceae bacterium]|nr:PD40 domain-containing protein [Kofleriaceae bacterium]
MNKINWLAFLLGSVSMMSVGASGCGVKQTSVVPGDDANRVDAPALLSDAATIDARLGAWSTPAKIDAAASMMLAEDDASLSPDELELTFAIVVGTQKQLSRIKRATKASAWGPASSLNIQLAGVTDQTPRYAKDGLTLFFASDRAGNEDVYKMTRATTAAAWSAPTAVSEVNTPARERWFTLCEGGRYLLISDRAMADNLEIYEGVLGAGAPTQLTNTPVNETGPFISFNCEHGFFATTIGTTLGVMESFRIADASWTTPTPVLEINTEMFDEQDPWLSADGKTMLFVSNALGTNDVYMITRM